MSITQGLRRDLIFKNCRVPTKNLLLGTDKLGTMMGAFNTFRLQNAARTLGFTEGALDAAIKWSLKRRQFGKLLCEFQMTQEKTINGRYRKIARFIVDTDLHTAVSE